MAPRPSNWVVKGNFNDPSSAGETHSVVSRQTLVVLLLGALLLPITICVLVAASGLLATMQDASGAAVLGRIAQAGGVLWSLTLIVLLIALGVNSIATKSPSDRDESLRDRDNPADNTTSDAISANAGDD
jgi:hypothetical protein